MLRLLVIGALWLLAVAIMPRPAWSDELSGEIKTWTKKGMLAGATSTEAECVRSDRVWVADKGSGYCIRYFKNRIEPKDGIAIVIFQGDFIGSVWKKGKPVKPVYEVNYDGRPLFEATRALVTQSKTNAMFFVSRLGTLGSSGDHKQKFKPLESRVINAALDQIKERYNLKGFVLAGQSGGALLAANLLAKRSDIACAVMNSGAHDVYKYAEDSGFDSRVWATWENPVDTIASLKPSATQYYVMAGLGDQRRPPAYQEMFADALAMKSPNVHYLLVRKRGDPHDLQTEGIKVADLCANGATLAEIKKGLTLVDKRYRLQLVKWLESGSYASGFQCFLGFKVGNHSDADIADLSIGLGYYGRHGRLGGDITHMDRLPAGETRNFGQTVPAACGTIEQVRLQSAQSQKPAAKGRDELKKAFTAYSMVYWISFNN